MLFECGLWDQGAVTQTLAARDGRDVAAWTQARIQPCRNHWQWQRYLHRIFATKALGLFRAFQYNTLCGARYNWFRPARLVWGSCEWY
eukprot:91257-Rhodomonas_salina.2